MNTTNNSLFEAEVTNDEILTTYCEVGLSMLTMLGSLINFFWIQNTLAPNLVYQIQQIDSLVTSVCQLGSIGILLGRISKAPKSYICTLSAALFTISGFHFLMSNLLMVTVR